MRDESHAYGFSMYSSFSTCFREVKLRTSLNRMVTLRVLKYKLSRRGIFRALKFEKTRYQSHNLVSLCKYQIL